MGNKLYISLITGFLVIIFTIEGCANAVDCFQGNGKWLYETYDLGDKLLKQKEPATFDVSVTCRSLDHWKGHQLLIGFTPADRFKIVLGDNKEYRYVEEIIQGNGEVVKNTLNSYELLLEIHIKSINARNEVTEQRSLKYTIVLPPYKFGFSPTRIMPADFRIGEKLVFEISITADDDFYDRYKQIGLMLSNRLHS